MKTAQAPISSHRSGAATASAIRSATPAPSARASPDQVAAPTRKFGSRVNAILPGLTTPTSSHRARSARNQGHRQVDDRADERERAAVSARPAARPRAAARSRHERQLHTGTRSWSTRADDRSAQLDRRGRECSGADTFAAQPRAQLRERSEASRPRFRSVPHGSPRERPAARSHKDTGSRLLLLVYNKGWMDAGGSASRC